MVCAILRVANDTPWTIHFHNTEDDLSLTVYPANAFQNIRGHIPSKSCDTWVPYQSSGEYIKLWIGNSAPVHISDDNYHWHIVDFPDAEIRDGVVHKIPGLKSGGQYVLLVKTKTTGGGDEIGALAILKYDSEKMGCAGYIASSVIQSAAVVVALVLMVVFVR